MCYYIRTKSGEPEIEFESNLKNSQMWLNYISPKPEIYVVWWLLSLLTHLLTIVQDFYHIKKTRNPSNWTLRTSSIYFVLIMLIYNFVFIYKNIYHFTFMKFNYKTYFLEHYFWNTIIKLNLTTNLLYLLSLLPSSLGQTMDKDMNGWSKTIR